ncbi:NUDIX domain-containing protein [Plantibacter sp. MCCC 1A11337]|uniref:NUDIX domain-containing protein n=1 Tax=Plantibacter sp. MCCC 1A11337 TaxID=2736644 RepID=UPI001582AF46|nr:NUDIX domain-containing protein [Plantibacter sp. MCCC 1A11337]NUJ88042.1 NUDIX domain-containing protein [Plantibacter sp. MCCC 1A11337]
MADSTTVREPQPGADLPDARGRTGLHRTGLDLTGNPRVQVTDVELVAAAWHVLRRTTLRVQDRSGAWSTQQRETYDRGNGATILLYHGESRKVLLTRQFRYPAYVNGHPTGELIETAAGLLDDDDPETAVAREAREETGFAVEAVQHVFDAFMSPGSVTERLHFYAAEYDPAARRGDWGGLAEEGEEIELLELDIDDAIARIGDDIIDAKTIMLLQWARLSGPFATAPTPVPPAPPAR